MEFTLFGSAFSSSTTFSSSSSSSSPSSSYLFSSSSTSSSSSSSSSASSSSSSLFNTSSSSSSSTVVAEKDLLTRLSDSNFENSGVDVNLTLRPPMHVQQCCICGGTTTPLWRNGPKGPKSACNACGIKYRKKMQKLSTNLGLATGSGRR